MSSDIYDEIARYDGEYNPESVQLPTLDTLSLDTDYDFEIVSATVARTQKNNNPICKFVLQVNNGPRIEYAYVLTHAFTISRLGADLCALNFDADKWRGSRAFSKELEKVMPKLPGIKFRGRVMLAQDGQHRNLSISFRHKGEIPAAVANRAVSAPPPSRPVNRQAVPATNAAPTGGDSIPF